MAANPLAYTILASALLPLVAGVLPRPLGAGPLAVTYAEGIEKPETPPVISAATQTPGSFTGTPTVTGALTGETVLATAISGLPPLPAATDYPNDGQLHEPQPAPFVPGGGLGTNGTEPVYRAQSDYDYQSCALALYMEWLQFDMLQTGLSQFSVSDWEEAGYSSAEMSLFDWMKNQTLGHVTVLTNFLGSDAPGQCQYVYPFTDVREFVDFSQKVTKVTESTVYGFLPHLDSHPVASLLLGSVSILARQQLVFRQLEGLLPAPVWFESSIPQSWGWSLVSRYIASCPGNTSRVVWQNFPPLKVDNQPNPWLADSSTAGNETSGAGIGSANNTGIQPDMLFNVSIAGDCPPGVVPNRTNLTAAGRPVSLSWELPGPMIGPNNSYVPVGSPNTPSFVAWVTQLNVTYTPLEVENDNSGTTTQPDVATFAGDPAVNGTVFVAVTDSNPFLTPFNISLINQHVVAGPAVYQAS